MASANSFGSRFVLTTFGESHGPAMGAVVDGCPAGVTFQQVFLQNELDRRRPGGALASGRQEPDAAEVLSGVYEGRTLGTPIAVVIRNADARPQDYAAITSSPISQSRIGHADDLWRMKYGHSDPRGGGRGSGRETVARVVGGTVAKMFLREAMPAVKFQAFCRQLGPVDLSDAELADFRARMTTGKNLADEFTCRFPSRAKEAELTELLTRAKEEGKSYGGVAELWIHGLPLGLGQPVFRKLRADLGSAMLSVGAVSGVEFGEGFAATEAEGSVFHQRISGGSQYGGIRGGISTGEPVQVRVAFKPTSSVLDVAKKGRHDPCIVPRAVPVLEAMAALVIADHLLMAVGDRLDDLSS